MKNSELKQLAKFSYMTIRRNLDQISHEDSIRKSGEGINTINWMLGHILINRADLLGLFGATPAEQMTGLVKYRNTETLQDEDVVEFDTLSQLLKESQVQMEECIDSLSEESLQNPAGDSSKTLGVIAQTYFYHEGYHSGQIGLHRRLIGKPGRIG